MVKLYPKHRLAPPLGRGIEVDFDMGDMGDPYYRPRVLVPKEQVRDLYERMRSEVEASPGITIAALARTFGKRVEPMGRLVGKASHFRVVPVRGGSPEVYLRKSS